MNKNNNGSAALMILIFLVIAIVAAGAFAFYTLKNQGALPGYSNVAQDYNYQTTQPTTVPEATISPDDDINTIEIELDSTNEGSVDMEFQQLESDAASL